MDKIRSINPNPCPKCGVYPTDDNIESVFGMRMSDGKQIRQSYCKNCRGSSLQIRNEIVNKDEMESKDYFNKLMNDTQNRIDDIDNNSDKLTSEPIEENYQKTNLTNEEEGDEIDVQENNEEELRNLHDEIEKKKRKLEDIEKIIDEEKIDGGYEGNKEFFEGTRTMDKPNPKNENMSPVLIHHECLELIKNYKNKSSPLNHNIELMDDLIDAYGELGSLSKLSEQTKISIDELRNSFKNLLRVPEKLRDDANESRLIADPILAVEIAIHATDYFFWDQNEWNTDNVILLAKNMAEIFKNDLKLKREFFATKDDYTKPVSANSKINSELKSILEDWPVKESKYEFNRNTDRTGRQYKMIVLYSKAIEAARFLRRWEYENGRRISKEWAHDMIDEIKSSGDAKEFVEIHSDEFRD